MRQAVISIFQRNVCVCSKNLAVSSRLSPAIVSLGPCVRQIQTTSLNLISRGEGDCRKNSHQDEKDVEDDDDSDRRQHIKNNALTTRSYFNSKERNKETFDIMIEIFKEENPQRRGVVEFINTAAKHMEDYSVAYDIATYKKLINLLPEGKYVPRNVIEQEFYHYPKQQDCITNLLDSMELKGVCPDKEMIDSLVKRFGKWGYPCKKAYRMLYWFPKFKNANPWPVPHPPIDDTFLLAKMAVERIVSVDAQSIVSVWQSKSIPDAIDDTYIVSGQSPAQQKLLAEHPATISLHVEGPLHIWVGTACMNYFMLRADGKKFPEQLEDPDDVTHIDIPFLYKKSRSVVVKPSVHEQEDLTVLAVCATGTSSRDALLSWIRLLQKNGNPALEHIPVIFSLKAPVADIVSGDTMSPSSAETVEKLPDS